MAIWALFGGFSWSSTPIQPPIFFPFSRLEFAQSSAPLDFHLLCGTSSIIDDLSLHNRTSASMVYAPS
jgi:hypothetical protein